jgi:dihydrolipoamide dehydrogenase
MKEGIQYQKSVYPYMNTAMGKALEDRDGFVKFLVDKETRKILGCHIIGSQASILIHEVLVAIKAREHEYRNIIDNDISGTIDNIINTIHIHPALSEVVARAASNF